VKSCAICGQKRLRKDISVGKRNCAHENEKQVEYTIQEKIKGRGTIDEQSDLISI
jgi:hypothetical protein